MEIDKAKNLQLFQKGLESCGVDAETLIGIHGERLADASFTHMNDHGNAYAGSLLHIVLHKLTPYAIGLNSLLPEDKRADRNTLVKICLLQHIAKSVRLVPNDNAWEVEKRKMTYKFDEGQPSIRTGLHSLIMAQRCGIDFTEEEAEAMTINDREMTDAQSRFHASILANIIRQANELTYMEING